MPMKDVRLSLPGYLVLSTLFVNLIMFSFMILPEFKNSLMNLDHCHEIGCDFIYHYYPMGKTIFTKPLKPISGFFYPPTFAMMILPICQLDIRSAVFVWEAIHIISLIIFMPTILLYLQDYMSLKAIFLSALIVLGNFAIMHDFKWGQVGLYVTLLILMGLFLTNNNRTFGGALLLAIAASIKLYPLVVIIYLILAGKTKATVMVLLLSFILMVVVPIAFLGYTYTIDFYCQIPPLKAVFNLKEVASLGGQSLKPALYRYFVSKAHIGIPTYTQIDKMPLLFYIPQGVLSMFSNIILVVSTLITFCLVSLKERKGEQACTSGIKISLFLCWVGLIINTGWQHYFIFLTLVNAIIALRLFNKPITNLGGYIYLFAFIVLLFFTTFNVYAIKSYMRYSQFGFTFLSNVIAWTLMAVTLIREKQGGWQFCC